MVSVQVCGLLRRSVQTTLNIAGRMYQRVVECWLPSQRTGDGCGTTYWFCEGIWQLTKSWCLCDTLGISWSVRPGYLILDLINMMHKKNSCALLIVNSPLTKDVVIISSVRKTAPFSPLLFALHLEPCLSVARSTMIPGTVLWCTVLTAMFDKDTGDQVSWEKSCGFCHGKYIAPALYGYVFRGFSPSFFFLFFLLPFRL